MAANDRFLVDGIIDQRVAESIPSADRGEVFEFLVLEQLLKDYDPSPEQLESGIIDGQDDGGIDGFFLVANGQIVTEVSDYSPPRKGGELDVYLVTSKHSDTFKQAPLDKLVATAQEFFDFGLKGGDLTGKYSQAVLECRESLLDLYRAMAPGLASLRIHLVYASRGDSQSVASPIVARARQLEEVVRSKFSSCMASCSFLGAAELVRLFGRLQSFSLELPYKASLEAGSCYVVLVGLREYSEFLSDEHGRLRRHLFDSNVRDFAGQNRVNSDIAESLMRADGWDFWWLNNGVTILASRALLSGGSVHIDDVQIVNGLQTSESIHTHFRDGGEEVESRSLLVKVIESVEPAVRDGVIRAANNQTEVQQASLWATDETQRRIEAALARSGMYYERRSYQFSRQGRPPSKVVTPLEAAAAHIALVLKAPASAATLKQRTLRFEYRYRRVFDDTFPLDAWAPMVRCMRAADGALERRQRSGALGSAVRFRKHWRPLLALVAVARLAGTFKFNGKWLRSLEVERLAASFTDETWGVLEPALPSALLQGKKKPTRSVVRALVAVAADKWGIADHGVVEARSPFVGVRTAPSNSLMSAVDRLLPQQPWPVGAHRRVAEELGLGLSVVSEAIEALIDAGVRFQQIDGVLYDADGIEVGRDDARFDSDGNLIDLK